MNCLVLLLPCLAHTGNNKVGPVGMQHLSEALKINKSLTSLSIRCTLGRRQQQLGREGSDKKNQGLGAEREAAQSSMGIGADLR